MKIDNVATSDIIAVMPSTTIVTVPSTSLRHRNVPRWLSVAETTIDKESAEILNSILELL